LLSAVIEEIGYLTCILTSQFHLTFYPKKWYVSLEYELNRMVVTGSFDLPWSYKFLPVLPAKFGSWRKMSEAVSARGEANLGLE